MKFSKVIRFILTSIIFVALQPYVVSQARLPFYLEISFYDKSQSPYSIDQPQYFLSQQSIQRKAKFGIKIEKDDLPVNQRYIDSVKTSGAKYLMQSKWFNSILVLIDDSAQISKINSIPFVGKTRYLGNKDTSSKATAKFDTLSILYGESAPQNKMIALNTLHRMNYMGAGINIAVFDAGFYKMNKMKAFEHLFAENRIKLTKDFVDFDGDVFLDNSHGMSVMSVLSAKIDNSYLGAAPNANYYLMRTENISSEFPVEEYFWLAAAEFVDSIGVDIINSSLGYSQFDDSTLNYSPSDMDGKTALISKAAEKAAEKGILVVSSAGNLGAVDWRIISAPADAEYVLSVGAVDENGKYAAFSSQAYTSDGRLKPNIVAMGYKTKLVSSGDVVYSSSGTSFAAPIISGAAACLWQIYPNASSFQIYEAIIKTSSHYLKPDSLIGYGIPNFYLAAKILSESISNEDEVIIVSPNPFCNNLYFYSKNDLSNVGIRIYNASGKMVLNKNFKDILKENIYDLEIEDNLITGFYILNISYEGGSFNKKIIKLLSNYY